jgi:hypothetical protein
MISSTAASATSIRTMLPHPFAAAPPCRCTGHNGMLPAGPQAMRMGAEEPEARVVMLDKQGGLFRIIVQNIHEKVSEGLPHPLTPPRSTCRQTVTSPGKPHTRTHNSGNFRAVPSTLSAAEECLADENEILMTKENPRRA